MADLADRAAVLEAAERAAGIDAVLRVGHERPLIIDSRICCRDCEEPIPLHRLAILPQAARCASCQEDDEKRRRAWCP